jgi:hypothetical protein
MNIYVAVIVSIVAPLFIPGFTDGLARAKLNKPSVEEKAGSSKADPKTELSVFVKDLPAAFIANAIWGITFSTNCTPLGLWEGWPYLFGVFFAGELLLLVRTRSNPRVQSFNRSMWFCGIGLLLATILRII